MKYKLMMDARRRAVEAGVASVKRKDIPDLERLVDTILNQLACDVLLSMKAREIIVEQVKAAVGMSLVDAVIEAVEQQVGDAFED